MSNEVFEKYGHNPILLCHNWLEDAKKSEPNDPEAICLATADKHGRPSNRMVLAKSLDENGLKFHTNANSHKGQDLAENPYGAICWYWKSTRKQIRMEGRIEKVTPNEADEYFTTRPIERQIGAWASKQSTPFEKRKELENSIQKYETEFTDTNNIPRPDYWQGYRLTPDLIEFWIAHRDRLHTRFVYTKTENNQWTASWLYP